MIPHFYKIYTRLGIINVPYKQDEMNYGVEKAPDSLLTKLFLSQIPEYKISEYIFPNYESLKTDEYKKILSKNLESCLSLISDTIAFQERQICIGGDHSITFSSLGAVLQRYNPKQVGYIQFDSQGDIHSFSSSHSGNFHGMFVRAFVDTFDDKNIDSLIPQKLPVENIIFIGNLDLEIEEQNYFKEKNIRNIVKQEIEKNSPSIHREIKSFIQQFEHLHITLDVDVFDRKLVSATGTPAIDGWTKEQIFSILKILKTHNSFSFDLVEVNPTKLHADSTIKIAQEILREIIK